MKTSKAGLEGEGTRGPEAQVELWTAKKSRGDPQKKEDVEGEGPVESGSQGGALRSASKKASSGRLGPVLSRAPAKGFVAVHACPRRAGGCGHSQI